MKIISVFEKAFDLFCVQGRLHVAHCHWAGGLGTAEGTFLDI